MRSFFQCGSVEGGMLSWWSHSSGRMTDIYQGQNYRKNNEERMCMRAKLLQCYVTLCDPIDCSPPGSSVHGISQARILEWVSMPSSRGSSWPRNPTCISCTAGGFFTAEPLGKPLLYRVLQKNTFVTQWQRSEKKNGWSRKAHVDIFPSRMRPS